MITLFDLRSAPDPIHARIPYLYLAYIAAGLLWYGLDTDRPKSLILCGKLGVFQLWKLQILR